MYIHGVSKETNHIRLKARGEDILSTDWLVWMLVHSIVLQWGKHGTNINRPWLIFQCSGVYTSTKVLYIGPIRQQIGPIGGSVIGCEATRVVSDRKVPCCRTPPPSETQHGRASRRR